MKNAKVLLCKEMQLLILKLILNFTFTIVLLPGNFTFTQWEYSLSKHLKNECI